MEVNGGAPWVVNNDRAVVMPLPLTTSSALVPRRDHYRGGLNIVSILFFCYISSTS